MLNFNTHSHYSYKMATTDIKDIVAFAKKNNNKSFCISDLGYVTSFVKAMNLAQKEGLKFIPGYSALIKADEEVNADIVNNKIKKLENELTLKRTTEESKANILNALEHLKKTKTATYHNLIILAKNQIGLINLFRAYSLETLENDIYLSSNDIVLERKEGLIFLTGGNNSEVLFYIQNGELDKAEYIMQQYKELVGDDYYCQIEYCPRLAKEYNTMINIAKKYNIPIVASNEVFYAYPEDEDYFHIYRNIMSMPEEHIESNHHLITEDELKSLMLTIYDEDIVKEAFYNIKVIEEKCDYIKPALAEDLVDCSKELYELCKEGWEKKRKGTKYEKESWERFHYELEVINSKNFSEYFIKVRNIVQLAKKLGILIGPGRGSGCGSEINYLIDITKVDPIKYGLYFERFLNPGRSGFPDIDLDMASSPIGYDSSLDEENEQGASASRNLLVSKLIELGFFQFAGYISNEVTASALVLFKNLCKWHEIPFEEANKITTDDEFAEKLKEKEYTGWLYEACERFGFEWEDVWDQIEKRMNFCYKLAGIPYNRSIAASGVIMSGNKADLPVRQTEEGYAIGYNGEDLESWKYIKFDLLSVNTLNLIQIFEGLNVDWDDTNDPKVWETIQNGDTDFVFQFSSPGMKHILKSVKPNNINTLAEINALYRPGPIEMGFVEKYISIKTGNFTDETRLTPEEEIMQSILKQEFGEEHTGLIVFQEDVMKLCQLGAGFSLSEADDIRKAMGKKKMELLEKYREPFIKNWKYGGDPQKIWEGLVNFGKYAFNKSHAVAYSIIAYMTAKIWTYYPHKLLEYTLNYDTKKRFNIAIDKCKELGIKFKFPTINNMTGNFYTVNKDYILIPGGAEKNYNSYVEFLFSDEPNIYNLIYKGVCDNLTQDRYALAELISALPNRVKQTALYMEKPEEKFTTLKQILDGLLMIGALVKYEDTQDGILVYVKRMRGEPTQILFHKDNSDYCIYNICKYDRKYFGRIRDGIISYMPYINTNGIEKKLENILERGKELNKDDNEIYYSMKDALEEYIYKYFSNPYKRTFDNVYAIVTDYKVLEKKTKIFVSFNDKDDIFYVTNPEHQKIVQRLDKNALVKMTLFYSPYIQKRTKKFIYDFDILEIEEIKF